MAKEYTAAPAPPTITAVANIVPPQINTSPGPVIAPTPHIVASVAPLIKPAPDAATTPVVTNMLPATPPTAPVNKGPTTSPTPVIGMYDSAAFERSALMWYG